MKITSGPLEVLDSGLINSSSNAETECHLSDSPPMSVMVCVKKSETESPSVELLVESNSKLKILFINPQIQLNFGPSTPIQIGTLQGRTLSAIMRINIIGDYNSYQIAYTFYLGGNE